MRQIYTSYFANLKNLPKDIVPISICGKAPTGYNGLEYKKLAPKWWFFQEWKKNKDNDFYVKHFTEEVLNKLNAFDVVTDLFKLAESTKIALVCYEKPGDFCHRHLVAEWIELITQMEVKEYDTMENTQVLW